jgi:hypothetical protein
VSDFGGLTNLESTKFDWLGGTAWLAFPETRGGDISENSKKSVAASEPMIDEMVGKFIRAGYLNFDQRQNPAAIAEAIDRMKRDLRGMGLASPSRRWSLS